MFSQSEIELQDFEREEMERSGREYGEELAAALVLASRRSGSDDTMKRQMAQIVLREIASAVKSLGQTVPGHLVRAYEAACRAGVRDELQRSLGLGLVTRRAA